MANSPFKLPHQEIGTQKRSMFSNGKLNILREGNAQLFCTYYSVLDRLLTLVFVATSDQLENLSVLKFNLGKNNVTFEHTLIRFPPDITS